MVFFLFDNNVLVSSLDAENIALQNNITNVQNTINNYEIGVASTKLNTCISSLINADRKEAKIFSSLS